MATLAAKLKKISLPYIVDSDVCFLTVGNADCHAGCHLEEHITQNLRLCLFKQF